MTPATAPASVLAELGTVAYVAGLAAFYAGIAVGMLFVFTDRHGYDRPVPPRIVGILLATGGGLIFVGWVGRQLGT